MTTHWETIHVEDRGLFRIHVDVTPEHQNPDDHFDDDGETAQAIADGRYDWFMVRVQARVADVVLGEDYLGACCYENAFDFVRAPSDYYEDMIKEATDEAQNKLAKLAAIYNLTKEN
jgi:hypothetical protein